MGSLLKRIRRNIAEREGIATRRSIRKQQNIRLKRLLKKSRQVGIPDHITEAYVKAAFKRGGNW